MWFKLFLLLCALCCVQSQWERDWVEPSPPSIANVWLTTVDQQNLLAEQQPINFNNGTSSNKVTIVVDETTTYQQIDGFGASFVQGSAAISHQTMSSSQLDQLISSLFSYENGIGISFLRQSLGATDITQPSVGEYTYDDVSGDTSLQHFSIAIDLQDIIPVLKLVASMNPRAKFMGTPWSPPIWMKNNDYYSAGTLESQYYATYAQYFIDFLKAYEAQGIYIYALTPQNEPLNSNTGMPTMDFPDNDEADFINVLGPALQSAGYITKILCWDHNWDVPDYPTYVLQNAKQWTYSAAWHGYAGNATSQTDVHDAFVAAGEDIETYFTEHSGGTWEAPPPNFDAYFGITIKDVITTSRNWAKTYVRWAMAMQEVDSNGDVTYIPNLGTGASCQTCRGIVNVNKDGSFTPNPDYYAIGQFSKFVLPNSYRIFSNSYDAQSVESAAYINPDGTKSLILYNGGNTVTVDVVYGNAVATYTMPAHSGATLVWNGTQSNGYKKTIDDVVEGSNEFEIDFSGSWQHCTNCDYNNEGYYNQSVSSSTNGGDKATITFQSGGIRVYAVIGSGQGIATFQLDNGIAHQVDLYDPVNQGNMMIYATGPVSPGQTHTVTITVTGQKRLTSSSNLVTIDRVDFLPLAVDDSVKGSSSLQWNYNGNWGHCTGSATCGNYFQNGFWLESNSWSDNSGDTASLQFTGTGVLLYGVVGPPHGIAEVSVDGGNTQQVDFYRPYSTGNVLLYEMTGLSSGQHTLTVKVTGNQNPSASSNFVNIDRADVLQDEN
eukprot:TRINITY_DN12417_c0_g1_i1.p1 TRINITY_DN12417_c0_g1~~TRINITY_DN12417_c0_g1_i1.p1  ORF type:complete len:774 (+),score=183.10 TRINITY_DN12417_c0_g1_i1:93-2414(+)